MTDDSKPPIFKRTVEWLAGERNNRILGSLNAIASLVDKIWSIVWRALVLFGILSLSGSPSGPPPKAPTDEVATSKAEPWTKPEGLFILPDKVKPKERKPQWPEEPMSYDLL